MKISIYALFDPRSPDTYFYIGQTSQKPLSRLNKHIDGALGKHKDCNKDIGQYDLEGNLLNRFKNTKEAVLLTGCSRGSIQSCLHGRTLTGYGFKWSFIN